MDINAFNQKNYQQNLFLRYLTSQKDDINVTIQTKATNISSIICLIMGQESSIEFVSISMLIALFYNIIIS